MEPLHYLIMRVQAAQNRRILSGAAALGLTPGQPKVLEFLLHQGEHDQKTIARHCEIEPATVGNILQRMELAGLIQRRPGAADRRAVLVSLTADGRRAAEEMAKVFAENDRRASQGFSEEERESLQALLKRVHQNLTKEKEVEQ